MTSDNKPSPGKQPSHIAYNVQEGRDGKNHWSKVGAAWEVKGGFNVQLSATPVDGRVQLRSREALEQMRQERCQQQDQAGPDLKP